ncbi:MAG: TIGR01212 family radical SAM protein [Deltaproteobacteria bacterium]|nr:TIGR01212 family radical SAM protein [Deltaproteobacteria bacterium]
MDKRYNDLNSYFRSIFGCRVQKITVDAGFSCPNRDDRISTGGCIFCNTRGSGTGAHAKGQSVTDQILAGKMALSRRYKAKKFIVYFQSFTNTYAPLDRLKSLYEEALSIDEVVGLSIGTRPDCVDEPVLKLIESYAKTHLIWVEYGLQSIHDKSLALINRGHDFKCFKDAVEATVNRGIKICAHVILGLPQEKRKHMIETAKAISKMGIDGIKIHLLYVIKGTKLERLFRQGSYKCLKQKQYVELVCDFMERIPQDMVIQRLTGDPHLQELVAPQWSVNKAQTLSMIQKTLEIRDSRQGKFASK